MLRTVLALLCWLLAASSTLSHAANVTNLFNTGVNSNGTLTAEGEVDPHWKLASGPGPDATLTNAYVVVSDYVFWLPNNPDSQWIAPAAFLPGMTGEFRYRTSFDLTGFDPAKIVLRLQVLSDNQITAVLLNHQLTGITFTNETARWGVKDLAGGFQSGTNTLEIVVTNTGDLTGFRCQLSATDTPLSLGIQPEGTNLLVHWPTHSPCHLLESTTNLANQSWVTYLTAPTNLNDRFEATFPLEDSARFFRLRRPPAPDPTPSVVWLEGDTPVETLDFTTNCAGSLGCSMTPIDGGVPNYLDASASIDWARCSTNDPEMEFVWVVRFPPEQGGEATGSEIYRLPRISGRNSPILSLPPNSLPALIPMTREWSIILTMTSKVDPTLTKTVRFRLRYAGSEMTLQDYVNERNGN